MATTRKSSPRSDPEMVRKRSSPSGSNTDGSASGGSETSRASSFPRRQLKTVSFPSDHQRPRSLATSSGGASSGAQGSSSGASSSSAAVARASPVSVSCGQPPELVRSTAPIRSRRE